MPGISGVFNTDQGNQQTSEGFTGPLEQHGIRISMDEKGRHTDNIFVEQLWRAAKYEEVYLKAYSNGREAEAGLNAYFSLYYTQRPHQALDYPTHMFLGLHGLPIDKLNTWDEIRPSNSGGFDLF